MSREINFLCQWREMNPVLTINFFPYLNLQSFLSKSCLQSTFAKIATFAIAEDIFRKTKTGRTNYFASQTDRIPAPLGLQTKKAGESRALALPQGLADTGADGPQLRGPVWQSWSRKRAEFWASRRKEMAVGYVPFSGHIFPLLDRSSGQPVWTL